jgi:hypothetical protein
MTLLDSLGWHKKWREKAGLGPKTARLVQGGVAGQPGVLPRILYPVHLGQGSPPHFAGDSWVIAPGPHGGLLEEVSEAGR